MMKVRSKILSLGLAFALSVPLSLGAYASDQAVAPSVTRTETETTPVTYSYVYEEYPLSYDGIDLHLDHMYVEGTQPEKDILLVHGLTYSSHEFDLDYEDYSVVRLLARDGYGVWRLDIAGYGQSGDVEDGFTPNSDYAAEDINAAVEEILAVTGDEKIDLLGWSWGTVTSSRYVIKYPDAVNKLVLYAPIISGLGDVEVTEDFHYNTWEHAADDFQKTEDGSIDYTTIDPVVASLYCSNCWLYDGDSSPNGGRRDLCVDTSEILIDLSAIQPPTLVICGDKDPYMNMDLVGSSLDLLPEGSELHVIPGAAHAVMLEFPYYHEFQDTVLGFLAQ